MLLDAFALQSGGQRLHKALTVERLDEEIVSPAAHGLNGHVDGTVSGDHDDRRAQTAFLDKVEDLGAAHVWQTDIEQDHIGFVLGEMLEGFFAAAGVGNV